MSGIYNFKIDKGETFRRIITWYSDSEATTPVNLTSYTARMSIKAGIGSSELLSLTTVNGKIALGGSQGTITFTISATETASLPEGALVYDLELISSGGEVTKLLKGRLSINGEVTT